MSSLRPSVQQERWMAAGSEVRSAGNAPWIAAHIGGEGLDLLQLAGASGDY